MKKSNFLGYIAGTAIGLAAMFSPTKDQDTIDNKVLSNLKPANQQEQVMDKSYMPDLSSIVGAGEAYAGENTTQKDYPSDEILKEWMSQPVEKTLEGTDYTKVNDSNYQQEVLEADRPTMVLFYANEGESSMGLAPLTRTLHEQFPEIKLCVYKATDGSGVYMDTVNELRDKYPLEKVPALLFYEENDEGTEYYDPISMMGGIKTLDFMKKHLPVYNKEIPENIVNK